MLDEGRPSFRGLAAAAAGLAVLASLVVGCSSTLFGRSGGPNTLTLYNGQHEQSTQALIDAFQRLTGIHVRVHSGDEDALAAQVEQEGSASPADVIYTENSPALMTLQEKGLLAPVDPGTLAAVPAVDSSPAGDWVGVSARVSVLVYNTSRLRPSQLPTSVLQLADPVWKGQLAIAPGETDFQPIVTSIAAADGQAAALAWLKAVKANASGHVEADNEALTSDVNSGQAAIGLIDHYYWYRLQKELGPGGMHSQVAYFAPRDPGYVIDISGAAILKTTTHMAAAQAFLRFLTSAPGQQALVASDSFEYPLRAGVSPPTGLRPFAQLQPAPVTVATLGDGSDALRLLQQAQLL